MKIDPLDIIGRFYKPGSELYEVLVDHSRRVADKSLEIAQGLNADLNLDLDFIETAAMLHDIGIFKTSAPAIGCRGDRPYICHGYLGRELLDDLNLPSAYGLVAERHTGAGITLDNIMEAGLPLPRREMVPQTLEEKIICCADKYFSKHPKNRNKTMTRDKIINELRRINPGHARRFAAWAGELGLTP
ncbi:MAG: HD domain-containing protein [Desulfobacter sp.]|nr:MAG: HD domain-containing protein [Desulfobacter sp.]